MWRGLRFIPCRCFTHPWHRVAARRVKTPGDRPQEIQLTQRALEEAGLHPGADPGQTASSYVDVVFVTPQGETICYAHSLMLRLASPYYRTRSNWAADAPNTHFRDAVTFPPAVWRAFIRYLYTNRVVMVRTTGRCFLHRRLKRCPPPCRMTINLPVQRRPSTCWRFRHFTVRPNPLVPQRGVTSIRTPVSHWGRGASPAPSLLQETTMDY